MIDLTLPLIGPAALALKHHRILAGKMNKLALLDYGTAGSGKTHGQDLLARELVGPNGVASIEQVNGQSLTVDLVRQWRTGSVYGNLFAKWTVKRIDELDCSSQAARNELLSLIDYLPRAAGSYIILATTNNYETLRADNNRRIESRFKCMEVNGPSAEDAAAYLTTHLEIPHAIAAEIAEGAKPDGQMDMMTDFGVNMRLCIESAQSWLAAQEAMQMAA